jgi:cell fate regulator YaaT (PSP1 superfamily)
MKVYGVKFNDKGKIYNFKSDNIECPINVTVIVETEKGLQFGKVVKEINLENNKFDSNLKDIIRISTKEDYKQYLDNLKEASKALKKAKEFVKNLGLKMNIIDANFTFDKKQLLFNFYAEERIDFRDLAKKLAATYKTRIELRQIGARDKAEEIGGIGICGRTLCCTSFLKQKESVTMNMAKNQNIALNPSKINGLCGRLLCCLSYEDEEYTCCRKLLPEIGQTVKTKYGTGEVKSLDILNKKYMVEINNELFEINMEEKNESN